jgi:hypothetical protein
MEKRERIVGAIFLVMFVFGLLSLLFQLVLDRLSGETGSVATYGVFGSMVAGGASGYAGLFYFLYRSQLVQPPEEAPPGEHPQNRVQPPQ